MKDLILLLMLVTCAIQGAISQTTADLFSIDGLSINAHHYNFYDGLYNTSYSYYDRREGNAGCDTIVMIHNHSGRKSFLEICGQKVYSVSQNPDYRTLLYDFGITVGDMFAEGIYSGFEVISTDSLLLDTGDRRKSVVVQKSNVVHTYVEGIGDVNNGLFPAFYDFEGYSTFICAKVKDEVLIENDEITTNECEVYSCIWPVPVFELEVDGFTVTTSNTSEFALDYVWDFGDGNTLSGENVTHTYANPGCYQVELRLSNDCYNGEIVEAQSISICVNNSWNKEYSNDSLSLKLFALNDKTDFVFGSGHLYKVTNDGDNWEALSLTIDQEEDRNLLTLAMWDEDRGVAGASGQNSIVVTSDGGQSWQSKIEYSSSIRDIKLGVEGLAYATSGVYSSSFFRSSDYGVTWEVLDLNVLAPQHKFYKVLYGDGSTIYTHAFKGFWDFMDWRLGVSNDNGDSWTFVELPFTARRLQFVSSTVGYGTDGHNLWQTIDGGVEWSLIPEITDIESIHFYDALHGWIKNNSGVVLYSQDGFQSVSYTICGNEKLNNIQSVSDSVAVATRYSTSTGTEKFEFDIDLVGSCNDEVDMDNDGYSDEEDCDDSNSLVNPGQEEIPYNGLDDDCNAATLDDDLDQDGFLSSEDCDDSNSLVNPGQEEIPYNGLDDDCNAATLDDDLDQDGFLSSEDCDDSNSLVNPGQEEIPYNGLDDDCNAATLDDDLDQDGFLSSEDCDDSNSLVNPGQEEIPYNGLDDDCNAATLDDDLDQDGFLSSEDCDDSNSLVNPGQEEIPYNGLDDDCDAMTLDEDLDQDGFLSVEDCDDTNAMINPDQEEIPNNNIDENCDGEDLVTALENIESNKVTIFPNPSSNLIFVESIEDLEGKINVYTVKGVKLENIVNGNRIDVSNINSGIYLVELTDSKSGKRVLKRIAVHH